MKMYNGLFLPNLEVHLINKLLISNNKSYKVEFQVQIIIKISMGIIDLFKNMMNQLVGKYFLWKEELNQLKDLPHQVIED